MVSLFINQEKWWLHQEDGGLTKKNNDVMVRLAVEKWSTNAGGLSNSGVTCFQQQKSSIQVVDPLEILAYKCWKELEQNVFIGTTTKKITISVGICLCVCVSTSVYLFGVPAFVCLYTQENSPI